MLHFLFEFPKFVLEIVFATQGFIWGMERKPHFRRRNLLFLASLLVISVILAFVADKLNMGDYGTIPALCYTILSVMAIGYVFILYQGSFWNRAFCAICGLILQIGCQKILEIVIALWELRGLDPGAFDKGSAFRYVVYYTIFLAACFLAAAFFGKTFQAGDCISVNGKIAAVYMLVLARNLIMNNIEPVLRSANLACYGLLVFSEAAYYILILCMHRFLFQTAQAEMDSRVTRELWRQDKRQYEQIKQNIDIVNIKCHDLRHQIRAARENGKIDEGFLQEVEKSISIYDSSVKSGNETLDIILTDKRLFCEAASIQLTCMADGVLLEFMERSDIISLFSNLLENAVEYESTILDTEKRFISLTVHAVNQFLSIHAENYFEGEIQTLNGLPLTGKTDKGSHGYGLKSVQSIAKKYGGSSHIEVADNMFQVNILIPLKQA